MAALPITLTAIALLFLFLVLLFLTQTLHPGPKQTYALPPGPPGLPILGNLFDLPPTTGSQPEYLHWLAHKDRYGPISSVKVLGQTMVIIHDSGDRGGGVGEEGGGQRWEAWVEVCLGYVSAFFVYSFGGGSRLK